jgi:basic amino acid/polyamine antiporter, APA family
MRRVRAPIRARVESGIDHLMARKLPGLTRALTGGSIAAVAYGEVGSSIYFALGVVALFALGLTPWVLLVAGALFMLVALSYAEGTAAIP